MKELLLIDALHITMGGGRVLLDYLINILLQRKIRFHLLRDSRCPRLTREDEIDQVTIMLDVKNNRKAYYLHHRNEYNAVLCFANIPAPVEMPCPVHTYVHNVNLLKLPREYSLFLKLKTWMKRMYIAYYSKNTDSWIVQTKNTEECLRRTLKCKGKIVKQLPFYNIPEDLVEIGSKVGDRTDYILVGDYTGTRGHKELVNAWVIMAEHGLMPTLHLTVSDSQPFCQTIQEALNKGAKIVNHGCIPFSQIPSLYSRCKATVYPSLNESLGLGILEAIYAGCDVIGADLPYVHNICFPSVVFNYGDAESIVSAVVEYENGRLPKSQLKITNKIDELIDLLLVPMR